MNIFINSLVAIAFIASTVVDANWWHLAFTANDSSTAGLFSSQETKQDLAINLNLRAIESKSIIELNHFKSKRNLELRRYCWNLKRFLKSPIQQKICNKNIKIIKIASKGAKLAIDECQFQFKYKRWNCTIYNRPNIYGRLTRKKNRETAFIYALNSAALMYEITRSCSKGDLKKCICDKKKEFHLMEFEKKNPQNENPTDNLVKKAYEWTGCSDNVIFGYKLSKTFVDSDEKIVTKSQHFLDAAKPNKLMNIHNNEVGRRIILKNMKQVCKCHGVSGSCSIKVCWKVMPEFRKIGNEIMKLYNAASRINSQEQRDQIKQLRQIVLSRFSRNTRPTNNDETSATHRDSLIYIDKSPNFCRKIQKNGLIGTSKRMCSHSNEINSHSTKSGFMVVHEKCEHLCCGKGFHSKVVEIEEDCECAFQWCCSVKCKKCKKKVVQYFCN